MSFYFPLFTRGIWIPSQFLSPLIDIITGLQRKAATLSVLGEVTVLRWDPHTASQFDTNIQEDNKDKDG